MMTKSHQWIKNNNRNHINLFKKMFVETDQPVQEIVKKLLLKVHYRKRQLTLQPFKRQQIAKNLKEAKFSLKRRAKSKKMVSFLGKTIVTKKEQ